MDLNFYKDGNIHFTGCAGAGMAPLMYIMHRKGFNVSGSDLEKNANTENLAACGLKVFKGQSRDNLPLNSKKLLLVYSSAVKEDNPELAYARSQDWTCLRRGEMLSEIAATYKRPVAISGSHGKTSVTAMLAHILRESGAAPGYMVGGKVKGWKFSSDPGNGDIFVTEVDESDGTHASTKTHIAVVTNVEDDHCWSVGGTEALYNNFAQFARQGHKLIYVQSEIPDRLFKTHPDKTALSKEEIDDKKFFKHLSAEELSGLGGFQRWNAAVAVSAAAELGIEREKAEKAVLSFPGVERRMTVRYTGENLVIMEDYAHHPTEVRASISALRERFPEYHLKLVFQPHRYARLQRYFEGFAEELSKADSSVIVPVFAAWVEKGENMLTSKDLAAKIGVESEFIDGSWEETAGKIISSINEKTLLAVLAAGDADALFPFLIKYSETMKK